MAADEDDKPTRIISDDNPDSNKRPDPEQSHGQAQDTSAADEPTRLLEGEDEAAPTRLLDSGDDATEIMAEAGPAGAVASLQPGHVLNNRFRLEEKLGQGAMGAVFRAVDQRRVEAGHHNPHVAIKLISGNFAQDARAFVALQRETDKSQTLAHPNIITVHDFDRDGDVFFMTMEHLVGATLDRYSKDPDRSRARSLVLIEDIANGVAYAHRRNVVHSDLKPQNLFLTDDGQLKILDFGIARAFSNMDGTGAYSRDPAEIVGLTPAYASCEMFDGEEPHPADDVYALGLIAYELLTGDHPFDRKTATEARVEGLKPKRVRGLKRHQWNAIAKALAFERADRWQDAEQFRRQFSGAGRRVRQLSTALVVAVMGFSAYLLLHDPEPGPEIPFSQLPAETQQQITSDLAEGRQALEFADINGALFYFDRAYRAHPRNPEVMQELRNLVDQVMVRLDAPDSPMSLRDQHYTVSQLLNYESLAHNPRLNAREDELAAQLE